MGKRSRAKGARIERYVADLFTRMGYPATRAARNGVDGGEDIICPALAGIVHIECKGVEAMELGSKLLADALKQATDAAPPGAVPVVIWKRNREQPRLTWDDHGTPATVAGEADIAAWLAWRVLWHRGRQLQEARSA